MMGDFSNMNKRNNKAKSEIEMVRNHPINQACLKVYESVDGPIRKDKLPFGVLIFSLIHEYPSGYRPTDQQELEDTAYNLMMAIPNKQIMKRLTTELHCEDEEMAEHIEDLGYSEDLLDYLLDEILIPYIQQTRTFPIPRWINPVEGFL